jgi:hypothetical protein
LGLNQDIIKIKKSKGTVFILLPAKIKERRLKGLSHEMDLAFDDMYRLELTMHASRKTVPLKGDFQTTGS